MISSIISRLVILVFGTLYPAYASYKAVKTKNLKEYVKWMMYWIVFALFTCAETFTDVFFSWLPFYYEIKVILVIWLLSPATKGSSILYRKFVHPALSSREQEIDEYINKAKEQSYKQFLDLGSKGVSAIMQTALKGGGGLVNQLRKSYSLSDLSDANFEDGSVARDETDVIISDSRLLRRSRRSPTASSAIYFSEADVSPARSDRFQHVRSVEDISSGYSSAEHIATQASRAQARDGLARAASLTRTRPTRVTRSSAKRASASEESDDNETFDTNIIFLNDHARSLKDFYDKKGELKRESSEDDKFDDAFDYLHECRQQHLLLCSKANILPVIKKSHPIETITACNEPNAQKFTLSAEIESKSKEIDKESIIIDEQLTDSDQVLEKSSQIKQKSISIDQKSNAIDEKLIDFQQKLKKSNDIETESSVIVGRLSDINQKSIDFQQELEKLSDINQKSISIDQKSNTIDEKSIDFKPKQKAVKKSSDIEAESSVIVGRLSDINQKSIDFQHKLEKLIDINQKSIGIDQKSNTIAEKSIELKQKQQAVEKSSDIEAESSVIVGKLSDTSQKSIGIEQASNKIASKSIDVGDRGGRYGKRAAPSPPDAIGAVKATLVLKAGIIKGLEAPNSGECKEIFVQSPKIRRKLIGKLDGLIQLPKKIGVWTHNKRLSSNDSNNRLIDSRTQSKSDNNLMAWSERSFSNSKGASCVSIRSLNESPAARRRLKIVRRIED